MGNQTVNHHLGQFNYLFVNSIINRLSMFLNFMVKLNHII